MTESSPPSQHPDDIVHTLLLSEGSSVRIHLASPPTVPLDPIPEYGGIKTERVAVTSFDAKVERADLFDAGETFDARLRVPESEWSNLGLDKHWEGDEAESWRGKRILECWASQFPNHDTEADEYESPVPDDSPIVTTIQENDFEIDSPPAPYSRPTLNYEAVPAKSVTNYMNVHTRRELGEIHAIEVLTETLSPDPRDVEDPRDIDLSPPRPDRPEINFEELSPLDPTSDLLSAVYTINRHAKRLKEEADRHYETGQGAEAKAASIRKDALYATKTIAIHRFLKSNPDVEVAKHDLGDVEMFLFDFGDVSFHQPPEVVADELFEDVDAIDASQDVAATEIEFSPSTETASLPFSLDEAVERLREAGIDPDEYLRSEYAEDYDYGYRIRTTFE